MVRRVGIDRDREGGVGRANVAPVVAWESSLLLLLTPALSSCASAGVAAETSVSEAPPKAAVAALSEPPAIARGRGAYPG